MRRILKAAIILFVLLILSSLSIVQSPNRSGIFGQVFAMGPHAVTARGNVKIDTSQSVFGGASGSFDGATGYLSTPASPDWSFGTGDFTIDFRARFTSLPGYGAYAIIYSQEQDGDNLDYVCLYNTGAGYQWWFRAWLTGALVINIAQSTTVSANTWYHVAIVRGGNSFYFFQNGNQLGSTVTNSASVPNYGGALYIGQLGYGAGFFAGWLDEIRVSKGIARWTSNFALPTSPYGGDSSTALLLHMDGPNGSTTFTDSSGTPDFSLTASPTSQTVGAGDSASTTLSLSALNAFTGTVALTVTSGCPTGVTCTVSPTSVSTFPGTSTLTVPTLSSTTGTYPVVVTGTSGSLSHSVTFTVTVTAPPAQDFTITASPTSQSIGAGGTATYTLTVTYSSTLSTTVNLAVTYGCPSGVTCTVAPSSVTGSSTATLSVPTLVTTPGGTISVTVTASSTLPLLSHSVTVQLTINGPGSYPVYVYAGSSRVIVTVSWSGSGTAAVYLTGPGGSPTLTESGAIVYDRTVYVTGTSSSAFIHRVTFTLNPAPTSTATWTALVSLSGSYTVTIEVNSPSPPTEN